MKRTILTLIILLTFHSQVNSAQHHPQVFLKAIQGKKNEGMQIYNNFCINCHDKKPIISLGAPRFQVKEDWRWRFKKGISSLFRNTNEGLHAMPPRGGCFECTDEQLYLAIAAMLPRPYKKDILINLKDHKKDK